MLKSEKNLKELQTVISGKNVARIVDSIRLLRTKDPYEGAIGVLALAYDKSDNTVVKEQIVNFLNDIKEPELRVEVISEIKRDFKPATIGMLVSSCWQSGLDYSPYAADLVKIFIKYDYAVAIECFTVMEESVQKIPAQTREKIITVLKDNIAKSSNDKLALFSELISVMRLK